MGKVTITPMDYYYYQLYVHQISKEELEEAGIVIDYTDEPYKAARKMQQHTPKKEWKGMRWALLILLVIYTAMIVKVGMIRLEHQDKSSLTWSSTQEIEEWNVREPV